MQAPAADTETYAKPTYSPAYTLFSHSLPRLSPRNEKTAMMRQVNGCQSGDGLKRLLSVSVLLYQPNLTDRDT